MHLGFEYFPSYFLDENHIWETNYASEYETGAKN